MILGRRRFILTGVAAGIGASVPLFARAQQSFGVFDEICNTVRDRFYDPTFGGRDWNAIGQRYRPAYAAADGAVARAGVVNAMLGELGVSHTRYYTPDEPAYYQLADVFFQIGRAHV